MRTIAASTLILLGCFGCASDEPDRQMAPDDPAHPTGIAFDPVSNVEVRTDSPWKTSWKGNWYYFESEENQLKFEVNQEAYIPEYGPKRPLKYKVNPNQMPR